MKRSFLLLSLLSMLGITAQAQDYTQEIAGVKTEVKFYSDDIVRITKYQTSDPQALTDPKLVVTMTPQKVGTTLRKGDKQDTLVSKSVMVICSKTTGLLSFYRTDGSLLLKERAKATFTKRTAHKVDPYNVSQSFKLSTSEAIYGFGQVQDGNLNHRNTSYSHMVQNNMSVWMPFFHSTRGYGLYWDLYGPCDFSDNSTTGATFTTEAAHAVDYYLLVGDPKQGDDVQRHVRQLTGKATMVPLWTYGYFQSRERYYSAKETLGVLQQYRKLNVPIDCVVQDWQYWGGNNQWNAMEFLNPEFKNDYPQMIKGIHDGGGHLLISIWANFGRDTKQFAHYKQTNQLMLQNGKVMSSTWPNNEGVGVYSPYQKSARDYYWKCLYEGLVSKGVDAYWVDSSEPDHYQSGEDWEQTSDFIVLQTQDKDNATLNPHSLESEHTWRSVRNVFPLMHASGVYEGHRDQHSAETEAKRVMIMTRSGFLGMQRYGAGTWSGDINTNWQTFANQIPAALNYSSCGIPSWNSDIGGFFGSNDDAELYVRWIQFGAFCTIMRSHGSGTDRAIYKFGKEGETYYDAIARAINLRYALLPYIYSTARRVHADDLSFLRAMGIAYPEDTKTHMLKDQFMFGKSILVAPVVTQKATSRKVYLPEIKDEKAGANAWYDLWTGERYDGGQIVNRSVDLSMLPLYVPAGTILPWGPKVQYSEQSNWDQLEVRVYPGANGTFTLYEDERDNYNYEQGKFTEIPFEWDDAKQTLIIGERQGSFNGMLQNRTFRLVLVDKDSKMGLGIRQSVRFSKEITYTGKRLEVKLDNNNPTVDDAAVATGIEVNPTRLSLYCGQSETLNIKAMFKNGNSEFVSLETEGESEDPKIATFKNGIVEAGFKVGQTNVNVHYTDVVGNVFSQKVEVDVSIPANLYSWKAYDWYRNRVADRLNATDIKYSSKDNTITITKLGAQNIALRYKEARFMEPGTKYLVAVATDVSKNKADSQLWHVNGKWVNIVNPDMVQTLSDGRVLVAWKIDESKGYVETAETVFGLTSTASNGKSVISYVGFVSDIQQLVKTLNNTVGVHAPATSSPVSYYSINGVAQASAMPGINIVDGRKVLEH
ncbi:MAG: DUF5110 domain-containing protein [Bacteroidales bacterium]|nr:DUF5110 domain-containing protein [Bacteroidales bacterium]